MRCEISVGSAFKGSLWVEERCRGPLIGLADAPRTGDEGLVRSGVPGADSYMPLVIAPCRRKNEKMTYNMDDIIVGVIFVNERLLLS